MAINVDLEERTTILAGVGPGLGITLSHYLVEKCNAKVIALTNEKEIVERVSDEFSEKSAAVYFVDLADKQTTSVFKAIKETSLGKNVYGLVNNAFIGHREFSFFGTTTEDFDRVFKSNVYAALNASQEAVKLMQENEPIDVYGTPIRGNIVTLSSIVGSCGADKGKPLYGASKAALTSIAQYIAVHCAGVGVVSVAIEPGNFTTPNNPLHVDEIYLAASKKQFRETGCYKRDGHLEELARFVSIYLDPQMAFATGTVQRFDGGYSANFRSLAFETDLDPNQIPFDLINPEN